MIVLNKDQFFKKLEKGGYISATVYEGSHLNDTGLRNFDKFIPDNKETLKNDLIDFAEIYPYKFCIKARRSKRQNAEDWDFINVDFAQKLPTAAPLQAIPAQSSNRTPEQIEKEIRDRIKLEMEIQAAKDETIRLQERVNEFETNGGKLAYVGQQILMQFLQPNTPAAPLQGTPENVDPNELERALAKLVEVLGVETVIKLANKLTPADPVINIVKNYANS